MDRLPFEVLLQIFGYLPLASFETLYAVFPRVLLDEALIYKLRRNKRTPMVNLISTNLHELSTSTANSRNESSLSLYFDSYDPTHRFIWTLPDFSRSQHYFKVKDAYVSHGKLVLRRPHDTTLSSQRSLVSLWDIRKSFPPTRAGSFSGASEYSRIKSQELTIHQPGCILDSCLIPSGTSSNVKKVSLADNTGEDKVIGVGGSGKDMNRVLLKRPALPPTYMRQVPEVGKHGSGSNARSAASFLVPTFPDPTCGYFLVERFAIDIPTFLKLYC
ncbi:hypothetical protein MAM1_0039c02836 [Mucor ambiguus]|uniref:F-box domain-containing protein n=1 Tax=Mucor ambiguus TaxID=91626 RepID=A0A0C9MN55_9FUNG|nr:hypothetical protein MAM1_0039c02836 [Mucor ambiguus]